MSNPAFGLSDAELASYDRDGLIVLYRELRGRVRAHDKRDRSALLRMAGSIASGLVANPTLSITDMRGVPASISHAIAQGHVARISVEIARRILTEVDK